MLFQLWDHQYTVNHLHSWMTNCFCEYCTYVSGQSPTSELLSGTTVVVGCCFPSCIMTNWWLAPEEHDMSNLMLHPVIGGGIHLNIQNLNSRSMGDVGWFGVYDCRCKSLCVIKCLVLFWHLCIFLCDQIILFLRIFLAL